MAGSNPGMTEHPKYIATTAAPVVPERRRWPSLA